MSTQGFPGQFLPDRPVVVTDLSLVDRMAQSIVNGMLAAILPALSGRDPLPGKRRGNRIWIQMTLFGLALEWIRALTSFDPWLLPCREALRDVEALGGSRLVQAYKSAAIATLQSRSADAICEMAGEIVKARRPVPKH